MLHVVLYQPEIPQNTGNIGRMCAITGSRLHLVHPLGFTITDKHLRRSGMDYWKELDVHHHDNWEAFLTSPGRPQRLWLLSTKAEKSLWDTPFADGDGLLFGRESAGVPPEIHELLKETRTKIPQINESLRSLNLSTAAGVAVYEALRQVMRG